jgi:hypothetical protein
MVPGIRQSGGGTSTSFQQTLTYGDVSLSVRFVSAARQLTIQDGAPIDLKAANVVLVDHVDDPKKLTVASTLMIPTKLPGRGEIKEPFGRSQEIFTFLRCDAEVPQVKARPVVEALCRDLRAANRGK